MTNQDKILTDEEIDKIERDLCKEYTMSTMPYFGMRLLETINTIRQLKRHLEETMR